MSIAAIASHWAEASVPLSYRDLLLSHNPDVYWRCGDATAGTNLTDETGNARECTTGSANPSRGHTGAIAGDSNAAIQFPGLFNSGTSHASCAWGSWMNRSTFTLTCWFKTTDTATNFLVTRWGGDCWGIDLMSSNVIRGYAVVGGSTRLVNPTVTGLRDGNWHMAALTYDLTSVRLLVDGASVGTPISVSSALATSASANIRLGTRNGAANGEQLNGQLDEVSFGPVISDAGIAALYARALVP